LYNIFRVEKSKKEEMKKLILLLLIPFISFSQAQKKEVNMNQMMKKKMEVQMKKKIASNSHKMKKINEKKIIERWEEYSKAFEYSDFDKIKTYFTFPVTLSLFDNPIVINDEDELIKFYKQIRKNVQDGYKYSKLKKSRVVWISKNICVLDATYSRFNDNYENIFTGRGIYMYKKVGNSWQMFSMSGIKMNNKK
jgi:hypothetical protein